MQAFTRRAGNASSLRFTRRKRHGADAAKTAWLRRKDSGLARQLELIPNVLKLTTARLTGMLATLLPNRKYVP